MGARDEEWDPGVLRNMVDERDDRIEELETEVSRLKEREALWRELDAAWEARNDSWWEEVGTNVAWEPEPQTMEAVSELRQRLGIGRRGLEHG